MPNIGPLELAIVLIIALMIFGPKRLPELGKSLGKGMREFKDSITGDNDDDDDEQARARGRRLAAAADRRRRRARRGRGRRRQPLLGERPRIPRKRRGARCKRASFDDRLTLVEHLDELRTRIIVSASSCVRRGRVLLLAEPRAARHRQRAAADTGPDGIPLEPLTFSPTEPFFTTVKLSFYGGILIALPFLLSRSTRSSCPPSARARRRSSCRSC